MDGIVLINLQQQKRKMFLFTYTEPTLKALVDELHPVRASWFKIGLELDIPHTELICFRRMHSDFSDSLCEMLMHWLKVADDPPPSWEAVITALKSQCVNEGNVAAQLESKYCAPVQRIMDESKCQPAKMERSKGTISKILSVTYTSLGCWFSGEIPWKEAKAFDCYMVLWAHSLF